MGVVESVDSSEPVESSVGSVGSVGSVEPPSLFSSPIIPLYVTTNVLPLLVLMLRIMLYIILFCVWNN